MGRNSFGLQQFPWLSDATRRVRRQGPLAPGGARPADGLARPRWAATRIPSSPPPGGCPRSPRPSRRFRTGPTSGCGRRWRRAASSSSTRTRPRRSSTCSRAATSSRSRRRRRARRSATTRRCSTRSCRTRRRARCICFRPRRSRRISWRSCTRSRSSSTHDRDLEIGVFTYDGDTPSDARRAIRGKAHVVLSNPDMLHSGILPHHPRWAKLFENLRFVVIDELHAYRGVFGSHLANIMRRLQRVCRHYGSDPIFICSSATIANPRELAEGSDRPAVRAGRAERRAARREVLPLRQSAGRQRGARHPPLVSRGGAPRRARVPQAQPAADPLRAEPPRDRDPDDVL